MRRLVARRVTALRSTSLERGLFGGDNRWLALWGALATARVLQRLTKPKPVIARFTLAPGQSLLVADLGSEVGEAAS